MPLSGNLGTISLSSVLQLLCAEKLTGILRVRKDSLEYQLFMLEGNIIYAIEPGKKARLGALLHRDGIVTKEQIADCLQVARQEKQALGKILVRRECITSEVLETYIYRQVGEILFTLFMWESGDFDFKETELNLNWLMVFKLNIMKLVLDATRRVDAMSILKRQIPRDTLVFSLSEKAGEGEAKKLNDDERRILGLIDGERSVRDIINNSGYDDFHLYRILYSFISAGLIEK